MTYPNVIRTWCATGALVAAVLGAPLEGRADVVLDWNITALQAHAAFPPNSIVRTRVLAMVQAAVHDALNAIDRRAQPYAFDYQAVATAAPEAAVASAAYTVMSALAPSQA